MNNIINKYIGYLENLCGFAKGTLKQHLRICKLWTEFLTSTKDKKLFAAEPIDLLHYIELRQKSGKVKNTTISKELWVKLNIEGKSPLGFIVQPSSLDIKVFAGQPGRQC